MAPHEEFSPALEVGPEVRSWPLSPVGNTGECPSGAPRGPLDGRGWHGDRPAAGAGRCLSCCCCCSECRQGPRRSTWLVLAPELRDYTHVSLGGMAGCLPEAEERGPGRGAGFGAPSPLMRPPWRPLPRQPLAVCLVMGSTGLTGSAEPRPPSPARSHRGAWGGARSPATFAKHAGVVPEATGVGVLATPSLWFL